MKLSDLAALAQLATPEVQPSKEQKTGYDGKAVKLRVELDTKARRGKTVTRISGFQSTPEELTTLAQTLKKSCGSGGTVGDNLIDLQGDHRDKVKEVLSKLGYTIRA